ncbi:serine/threonine-protein kinase [Actinoplanes sp. NPDC023801]|uniref:serine/threonine-protein kinase n=1 Tax=Actinoplanes sp. NPDC023801 TaxID=3154595 RepID=UPI0033E5B377
MPDAPVLLAERYRLGASLGRGGMGQVFLARDETLQRDVAIKEIDRPLGSDGDAAAARRTLREARAAARINHPNVVQVYDVLQLDDRTWIVMEYVPSRSLREEIAEQGSLDPYRVARIGLELLGALRTAHRLGVEHRDVKPANVLLTDDGRVLLTDFGIAAVDDDAVISRSDVLVGSPQFMAPERAQGTSSGPEADLWSLGATLYAAIEGHAPYQRGSTMATLAALATEEPDPPVQAGPLRPLLDGLLRKDPATRMAAEDAESLAREIIAELTGEPEPSSPAPRKPGGLAGLAASIPAAFRIPRPRYSGDPSGGAGDSGRGSSGDGGRAGRSEGPGGASEAPVPSTQSGPSADRGVAAVPTPTPTPTPAPTASASASEEHPESARDAGEAASGVPGTAVGEDGRGVEGKKADGSAEAGLAPTIAEPEAAGTAAAHVGGAELSSTPARDADTVPGTNIHRAADTNVDSDANTSVDTNQSSGTEANGGTDTDLSTEANGGTDTDLSTEANDGTEANGGTETGRTTETGRGTEANGGTEAGRTTETNAGADSNLGTDTHVGTGAATGESAAAGPAAGAGSGGGEAVAASGVATGVPAAHESAAVPDDEPVARPATAFAPRPQRSHVPDDEPTAVTGKDRPNRRGLLIGAGALAVVIAAGATWAMSGDPEDPKANPQPNPSATATSAGPAATSGGPPADAVQQPPASPSSVPSATPSTSASGGTGQNGGGRPPLPAGWKEYRDATGFSVYVPEGWAKSQEGSIVYFRKSGKILGIDQTDDPRPDPVKDWRTQARTRVRGGDFVNYQEVGIKPVDYFRKAADWEFLHTRDGVRKHVNNRGTVISDDKAYGFFWETPESEWAASRDDLKLIFDSFQPAK